MIKLPPPLLSSSTSVEEALASRRSVREYTDQGLSLEELGQLLWSAYGVTSPEGYRTAPSAMTLYPLRIYVVAALIEGLPVGLYRHDPVDRTLEVLKDSDFRAELYACTFDQKPVRTAPAVILFTGVYSVAEKVFGASGSEYVHMDLGHAGQNVHLQAESLGLGTVVIAAFRREAVRELFDLPAEETPLYLMPVGHAAARKAGSVA